MMQAYSTSPNRKMDPVVVFYAEAKENKFKSAEEGRPIYEDVEMVRITFPADRQRTLVARAHASAMAYDERGRRARRINGRQVTYAELFNEEYRRFKSGQAPTVRGTPLREATFLTEAQRKSLQALQIYTVEQLAAANPKHLGMGGVEMVEKAKAYLDAAAGSADVTRLATENAKLREQIERMTEEMRKVKYAEVEGDPYSGLSVDELKERIAAHNDGRKPLGNPSRETLVSMLKELEAK